MKTAEYREGATRLVVPAASLKETPPPTSPAFFNPAAALNRDISVAVVAATGGTTFCDSMAGVGARGVRVANEASEVDRVTIVDFNEEALKLARRSASLNGVGRRCEFTRSETSAYLYSRYGRDQRFDYVDVDPFGTPIRQLQAGLCATADGGILSVTATDTAVLCGVYPKVSKRRYGATPLNNSFNHETGIRVLLGAIAREGASIDIGAEPVAAHATRHYLRVFARVTVGALRADRALGRMGFVVWCPSCGHASTSASKESTCEKCSRKAMAAGPLWLGELSDDAVVRESADRAEEMKLSSAARLLRSLRGVGSFPPWSFDIDRVCSGLKLPTVSERAVYDRLGERGFRAVRTPFERTGVKTDAPYDEVVSAVKAAGVERRPDPLGRSYRR